MAEYSTQISSTPQVSYLTTDSLGSPRIVTDGGGAVISRHDYRAFGDEVYAGIGGRTVAQKYSAIDAVRQQYTGYERDIESGLDYAQARYYNSAHGRFTSVDPLTASAAIKDPQSFNRYSYANNSPYKFTDPLGLMPMSNASQGWDSASNNFWGGDASASSRITGRDIINAAEIAYDRAIADSAQDKREARLANSLARHGYGQLAEAVIEANDNLQKVEAKEVTTNVTVTVLDEDPPSMGTIIVAYGQSGTGNINVGENFARAARTAQENVEAQGYNVINVGEIGSLYGFQNLLDTAAKSNAIRIYLFTHGASVALDIGNGARSDTKDVTMVSVKKLYNSSKSLESIFIHGCNVGASDNGIGQALSNQLGVRVRATTTGQIFSARPDGQTNLNGQNHPNTGPTYMIPVGRGIWRNFYPSR